MFIFCFYFVFFYVVCQVSVESCNLKWLSNALTLFFGIVLSGHILMFPRLYRNMIMLFLDFANGWKKLYNMILYSIGIHFPEKHIILYFSFNMVYIKGKAGLGVLVGTMRADLIAFKRYCKARQRLIPIFEYTELEFLLMGYKYIQKKVSPISSPTLSQTE